MVSIALVDARKHHLRGFKIAKKNRLAATRLGHQIAKKIGSPLRGSDIKIAKKNKSARRYAARGRCSASSLGQTPPWKKARSAPAPPPPPGASLDPRGLCQIPNFSSHRLPRKFLAFRWSQARRWFDRKPSPSLRHGPNFC